jgi:DUF4097 and DUF4098 domain-containing protein YvlB
MKTIIRNTKRIALILTLALVAATILFTVSVMLTTGFSTEMYVGIGRNNGGDADFEFPESESYSNISIFVTSSEAVIRPSQDGITRVIYTTMGVSANIEAEIKDDTLHVRERWVRTIGIFSIRNSSKLIIEVPEAAYNNISLSITSGSLDTRGVNLECNSINMKITSGRMNVGGITAEDYSINCTSGNLTFDNASGKGNVRVTSGSVTVNYDDWNDSLTVNVTSGNLTFNLPAGAGMNLDSRVTSGRVGDNLTGIRDNIQDVNVRLTSGSVRFNTKTK